jgi:8-oxo-dGTP diphosphatase
MVRKVKCQVWLLEDGYPVLGEEGAELLSAVEEGKSLDVAARAVGMIRADAQAMLEGFAAARVVEVLQGTDDIKLTTKGEALLQEYLNKRRRIEKQLEHLFTNPSLTTDGIVLVDGRIVLVKRGEEPAKGHYALPGGFIEYGERAEDSVVREVLEETGLHTEVLDLVGVYSDPARDPRGHLVSLVFFLRPLGGELQAGDDAESAALFDLDSLPELAFDHSQIIDDFRRWAAKGERMK